MRANNIIAMNNILPTCACSIHTHVSLYIFARKRKFKFSFNVGFESKRHIFFFLSSLHIENEKVFLLHLVELKYLLTHKKKHSLI